ncbi:cytochrome c [Mucilaginibacter terrenus]|uniref:Cytochrome c n=1 Tax=Mucilaginibacter terrenus TaxID=2482727 RepID=A0A3E2NV68_9SPHI|nr:cytochrome c [Mucilaginibacter terrenus]RFZ84847.1 cytochrome c [Mucilaginibacter terrenus]
MKAKTTAFIAFFTGLLIVMFACESQDSLEFKRYYVNGKLIYQQRCQNCHGANGEGLSNLMPPLTDVAFLKKNKQQLPCFVNLGLKGKLLVVNGKTFSNNMPANDIAPVDIAEVLTYVTNSFGNKMGVVTAEQVTAQLKACK